MSSAEMYIIHLINTSTVHKLLFFFYFSQKYANTIGITINCVIFLEMKVVYVQDRKANKSIVSKKVYKLAPTRFLLCQESPIVIHYFPYFLFLYTFLCHCNFDFSPMQFQIIFRSFSTFFPLPLARSFFSLPFPISSFPQFCQFIILCFLYS